jgi:hypothetical protein
LNKVFSKIEIGVGLGEREIKLLLIELTEGLKVESLKTPREVQ